MGIVKLEDGKEVSDRRVNGNRLKLDVADWIKLFITIFTTFVVIVFGAGKLITSVNANTKTTEENSRLIEVNSKATIENDRRLAKTESEITNIKENLVYIREKVDKLVLKIK